MKADKPRNTKSGCTHQLSARRVCPKPERTNGTSICDIEPPHSFVPIMHGQPGAVPHGFGRRNETPTPRQRDRQGHETAPAEGIFLHAEPVRRQQFDWKDYSLRPPIASPIADQPACPE